MLAHIILETGKSKIRRMGWQAAQSLLLSTRGFADQIRATLEKAAAVAGDISSNSVLANELEGS